MVEKMARQTITTTVTRERKKKKKIPKLDMSDVQEIPSLKTSGGKKKNIS
jgi:hypothetical protein